jgi:hypothetical protein
MIGKCNIRINNSFRKKTVKLYQQERSQLAKEWDPEWVVENLDSCSQHKGWEIQKCSKVVAIQHLLKITATNIYLEDRLHEILALIILGGSARFKVYKCWHQQRDFRIRDLILKFLLQLQIKMLELIISIIYLAPLETT